MESQQPVGGLGDIVMVPPVKEARERGVLTRYAPEYDWELFCDLVYDAGRWPVIVRNFPTDATTLTPASEGEELPHHALLDARIIAGMFASVSRGKPGGA